MIPARGALRAVPPVEEGPFPVPEPMRENDGLSEWVKFTHSLWHNRWLIVACVIVSLALATAYNYTARPRYQAIAQIEIRKSAPNLAPGADVLERITPEWIETQLRMLIGKTMITKVVERYDFASSPELKIGPMRSPLELIQTRILGRPNPVFGSAMNVEPAVAAFRSRVTVRPIAKTSLVELVFVAYDPQFAAMAANGLAQTYVDESKASRTDQSTEATKWLEARLQVEQDEAKTSFEALRSFEDRSGSANLEARARLVESRLQGASAQLLGARGDAAAKRGYRDQLRSMGPNDLMALPELSANASFQAMKKSLLEAEARKADLDQSLGPKHPDVVALAVRIQSLNTSLVAEARGVVRAAEAAYEAAARQEGVLNAAVNAAQSEMSALRDKSPEYMTLKRDADAANAIAERLAMRGKEASVEGATTDRTVQLVEPADVPSWPVFPDRAGNLRVALVAGLGIGILLVAARDRLDTTLKNPDDVREALRVPFLGFVPDLTTLPGNAGNVGGGSLHAIRQPTSQLSESYRVIRTNVMAAARGAGARVLLVTSIHPGEGKSTTALNLAAVMAQAGATVVLVDADLRRPTVHSNLDLSRRPGVREILSGDATTEAGVRQGPIPDLWALPAGLAPDNPAELMGMEEMRSLLKELSERFEWVVVDAPPVAGMADALVLGGIVDGVVLVIEGDRTTKAVAADGVAQLESAGGRVMGAVLNRVDIKRNSYYMSRYATGYYGGYGSYGTVYSRYAPAPRQGRGGRA